MPMNSTYTAIIEKDDDVYTSLCPELDIASQGDTYDEAKSNLIEAVQLFFECASQTEVIKQLGKKYFITHFYIEVA